MYSISARANAVFFFTVFVLGISSEIEFKIIAGLSGLNILTAKLGQITTAEMKFEVAKIPKL
jgi:hypothetical protein